MQQWMIGDYRVVATLGRGGMAEVYLAVRRSVVGFTKLIVIKKLRSELSHAPEGDKYRALLLDEARLAARLHHPNIVQTFEIGEDRGEPFMAMEYLDGQPLNQVVTASLRSGMRLPTEVSLRVIIDLLRALAYAHDLADYDGSPLNIVHRDVSPQNIFCTYTGEVKLVDFGVAKSTQGTETEAGVVKGKAAYMSPEQANGEPVDRRTDIFATGILLWELIAAKRLMRADSAAASLRQLLFEPMPALETVCPDVDPAIARICARALDRDLSQRYGHAAEMAADLEVVLETSMSRRRSGLNEIVQALFVNERREADERIRAALLHEQAIQGQLAQGTQNIAFTPPNLAPEQLASGVSSRSQLSTTNVAAPPPPLASPPPKSSFARPIALLVATVVVVGGATWFRFRPQSSVASIAPTTSAGAPTAAASVTVKPSLRLCGSNTIGAQLAPALVEAFLKSKGAPTVVRSTDPASELATLEGSNNGRDITVAVQAKGTATAFEALASGSCDIGMASRAINDAEAEKLATAFGELRSPATEHVVALDGIAVIVQPNNRVGSLDRRALHDIFAGKTKDWSGVGGGAGPISLFVRDQRSGTFDTFKALVLGDDPVPSTAKRFASSEELADAVASDVSGIGFIGLAYVRSAKAVAVGDAEGNMMLPTSFTVTTEDYMLARRLYFYSTPSPKTSMVPDFINYALSTKGQAVVRDNGFVDLDVVLRDGEPCTNKCPPRYAASIAHAKRFSFDFRFRTGGQDLDSRASRDVDRLVAFLRDFPNASLVLAGFSEATGDPAASIRASKERAAVVAKLLAMRGLKIAKSEGYGGAMPIAATGKLDLARERRVEVWLQPGH